MSAAYLSRRKPQPRAAPAAIQLRRRGGHSSDRGAQAAAHVGSTLSWEEKRVRVRVLGFVVTRASRNAKKCYLS